jgi:hypothetical protein
MDDDGSPEAIIALAEKVIYNLKYHLQQLNKIVSFDSKHHPTHF